MVKILLSQNSMMDMLAGRIYHLVLDPFQEARTEYGLETMGRHPLVGLLPAALRVVLAAAALFAGRVPERG